MSIIFSFLPLLILLAIVVLVVRKVSNKSKSSNTSAQPVRLFFQYALAFGLFITVTVGLSGLLGRVIDSSNIVSADQSSLASNLAFIVVGAPLLAGITLWLRKSMALNPSDGTGFVPTFFATLLSIISLLVFLTSAISAMQATLDNKPILGASFARAIIWGIALVVILRIANSVIPKND
ncbi:MAG: hypothetical protein F2932_05020, partial [Actinobacteria bacterium]|nr:hypothetical protein [Actinomycetota bacterium]